MTATDVTRRRRARKPAKTERQVVRVAAYCRKSVDKGNGGEYGSIESQREAVEHFAQSQREKGWQVMPDHYDDLGVSGATANRPAFNRLLDDIAAGRVDMVGVYRLDRLSRSQADFLKMLDFFEQHDVQFFSVSESFDTSTPHGRFAMGMIIQVAQLEREVTAERVADKMAASRRRGMWTGGRPILGYDIENKHLVINPDEAEQVRAVYALYLEHKSYLAVLRELEARSWRNKSFVNKRGDLVVGGPFNKSSLPRLLKDPRYIGMVAEGGELHEGQHEAIVDKQTWHAVEALLAERGQTGHPREARAPALLAGLVRCGSCRAAMGPHSARRHGRTYHYYRCQRQQKRGAKACPGSSVPAAQMDEEVMKRVRLIGNDDALIKATARAAQDERDAERTALRADKRRHKTRLAQLEAERARLQAADQNGHTADRLVTIANEIEDATRAHHQAGADLKALASVPTDEAALRAALATLDDIWDSLFSHERARLLGLLISEVRVFGATGEVEMDIRDTGIESLREELADEVTE